MPVALPKPGAPTCRWLALAGMLALAVRATEPEGPAPGRVPAPPPVLPVDLPARAPWDPGPPARDPEERIEADPAWSLPSGITRSTDQVPDLGSGKSMVQLTLTFPGVDADRRAQFLKENLLHGKPLPFFQDSPGERVGQIKFFFHEIICKPPMRHLTWGKHGILYWVGLPAGTVNFLTPAGFASGMTLEPNRAIHAFGRNQGGDLAYFGDVDWGIVANEILIPRGQGFAVWSARAPGAVRLAVPGLTDDFWVLGESGLYHWEGKKKLTPKAPPGDQPWFRATSLAPRGDGDGVVAVIADTCQVFKLGKSGRSFGIALDQASRPHSAAPGPRGETWVSLEGRDRYMVFQPGDGEVRMIELDPDPAGPRGMRSLTMGPDGNMWFALASPGALMRMTPDGEFVTFGLPLGDVPVELVPTDTGILFTLENSSRLGFIRALPVPEDKGWVEPIREPRPVREKKLSREQAHALHDARVVRAQERAAARLAEGEPAGRDVPAQACEPKEVEAPMPRQETREGMASAPAGPAPAADPWRALKDLGVLLNPEDIEHILDGHAHDSVPRKPRSTPGRGRGDRRQPGDGGRFAVAHSSEAGQLALLARALKDAGEIGRITDDRNRYYTKCRVPNVGCYHAHGAAVATDYLLVVMDRYYNEHLDDYEYGIVTAFPVHPHW